MLALNMTEPDVHVICFRYETVNVNLKHKPTWLFERNPLGLVPVIDKGDLLMHDSLSCNDLPDDLYPLTPLRPTDSLARARQRMLCDRFITVRNQGD